RSVFFLTSRRRHTRCYRDWSSDVCSSDLREPEKTSFGAALKELLGIRNFVTLCSLNAIGSVAWWIVYTWLPLHLYERFHMSLARSEERRVGKEGREGRCRYDGMGMSSR